MGDVTWQAGLHADHGGDRHGRQVRQAFRAHTSKAFLALTYQHVSSDQGESGPSVPNCEKIPTSDASKAENHPTEYRLVERVTDARDALQASISRSRERERKVFELIGAGEVAHAKRLAYCRRKSVELECPKLAGGCGSQDNYVAVHCDSRLCPVCMRRKKGQVVGRYRERVESWDSPVMFRLSLPDRVSRDGLQDGIDALREAFGNLRRRVVPPEGTHQGKRWVWRRDGGAPADHYWKAALCGQGDHGVARRWQKRYVDQGKGIPFSEVVRSGFYGIDIKQKEDGRFNIHLHVLADCPYLPQAALASMWDDVIGAPVVDIRRVEERGESDRETALMETIGYAAKAPEFEDLQDEVAYLTAVKGTKLIQPFGELHGNTPEVGAHLVCCRCGAEPAWWNYQGVVQGLYETAVVGSSSDGDRPPPEK